MVKVIMTWNIQEDKEREYIDYAVSEFSPTLGALGMQISEVWYTLAGNGPEIIVTGMMPSRDEALSLLHSRDWRQLRTRLEQYVDGVKVKVVQPKGPFQM